VGGELSEESERRGFGEYKGWIRGRVVLLFSMYKLQYLNAFVKLCSR
jgi:hypothetical protein